MLPTVRAIYIYIAQLYLNHHRKVSYSIYEVEALVTSLNKTSPNKKKFLLKSLLEVKSFVEKQLDANNRTNVFVNEISKQ